MEEGVYGDEDGAVFVVASCEVSPDEDLCIERWECQRVGRWFTESFFCAWNGTVEEYMERLEEWGKRLCTIAMHLASPTRIKPSRSSGSSGRKAHARPS